VGRADGSDEGRQNAEHDDEAQSLRTTFDRTLHLDGSVR
jgi:hypothetical protein